MSCPLQSKQVPSCGHKLSKRSTDVEKQINKPDSNKAQAKEFGKRHEDGAIKELLCCIRNKDKAVYKSGRRKRTGVKSVKPHKKGKRYPG